MSDFKTFRSKMENANVSEAAILGFQRNYEALCRDETGIISEDLITPIESLVELDALSSEATQFSPELLAQTVVIKLNGGLGTSMGLQKSKTLLKVRDGETFLDIILNQIIHQRESTGAGVKLLLLNSFNTSESTLKHLEDYAEHGFNDPAEVELFQNQIPKIDRETMQPVEYPENPHLEWCPPGHGDVYTVLSGNGMLDKLLAEGVKYAFISNADNLGAVLDPALLSYFAESEKPFLMEVTRRTVADKKGGHLTIRKEDGQKLLREVAQTAEEDLDEFQNIEKHQYFNTNNIWVRLDSLKEILEKCGGVIPLPMIKNTKTVDPRDKQSTPVFQLEVAMGAAIECFEGADAICVSRSRFAPVKTTADLFALRSDAYMLTEDGRMALIPERDGKPPVINLSDGYKLVDALGPLGIPSLKEAEKLTIDGPVRFTDGVVIQGEVTITNTSEETKWVAAGIYKDESVEL